MSEAIIKQSLEVKVLNPSGIHVRVSTAINKKAREFLSDIYLCKDGYRANCKSVLDLLGLMSPCGEILTLETEGKDAVEAAAAIVELFQNGFGEM